MLLLRRLHGSAHRGSLRLGRLRSLRRVLAALLARAGVLGAGGVDPLEHTPGDLVPHATVLVHSGELERPLRRLLGRPRVEGREEHAVQALVQKRCKRLGHAVQREIGVGEGGKLRAGTCAGQLRGSPQGQRAHLVRVRPLCLPRVDPDARCRERHHRLQHADVLQPLPPPLHSVQLADRQRRRQTVLVHHLRPQA